MRWAHNSFERPPSTSTVEMRHTRPSRPCAHRPRFRLRLDQVQRGAMRVPDGVSGATGRRQARRREIRARERALPFRPILLRFHFAAAAVGERVSFLAPRIPLPGGFACVRLPGSASIAGTLSASVLALLAVACQSRPASTLQAQGASPQGYIGGVVQGASGPEAGVWVIAETKDLPTNFIKIVVTDDRGRFMLPELPSANYSVWVRGYGLVDSTPVQLKPNATDVTLQGGAGEDAAGSRQGLSRRLLAVAARSRPRRTSSRAPDRRATAWAPGC